MGPVGLGAPVWFDRLQYPHCMAPTVTLTRQQLYDLVWSKPMTSIAAEFGVSSVAFAKHCTKLDVPRPGRGYWQQLRMRLEPERDPLRAAGEDTPDSVELTRHEKVPGQERPAEPPPVVEVQDDLRGAHPLVATLRKALGTSTRFGLGLLAIRGVDHAVLKVAKGNEKRALLILDALFKALVARGHELQFGECYPGGRQHALRVLIGKREVEIWLTERLEQTDHVETPEEKDRRVRFGSSWAPKFDQVPSGNLVLEAKSPWDARLRHRWRDSEQQRLEGRLGEVVLGLEAIAAAWIEHDGRVEEEQRARQREQEAREATAARAAHLQALAKDLVGMAEASDLADKVRRFLDRVQTTIPENQRSEEFVAWFRWAAGQATSLDPLSRPERIAKRMTPDGPLG